MSIPQPWLAHYPADVPARATPPQPDGLSLFRAAVSSEPTFDALRYFDGRLTYAELDALSDALAVALARRGFAAGDRLAIWLQNMPAFPIATLAAWKLGGIAVTINPMNREYELAKLLADATPKALVCLDSLADAVLARLPAEVPRPEIVFTASGLDFQHRDDGRIFAKTRRRPSDFMAALDSAKGETPPLHQCAPADVAFIVYTSGTTGQPKGARITHDNLAQVSAAHRAWYALSNGTPILAAAPLFHITGLAGHMVLAWALAAPLVLCHRFEPGVVLDAIAEHQPRYTANAITAYIALMTHPAAAAMKAAGRLASLATVTSGGAPVPPSVALQVEQKLGWHILNGYGLTETSSGVIIMPRGVGGRVDPVSGALSVGIPVSGVEVWVEGEGGVRLGHDEIGEIVIHAPMVADGYWNKPAESAESMRPDGFRSGDIGFMDVNGWFYIVDRKKDMINASGYKVWPREVEDVLYAHPAVLEAAVIGVGDEYRGETVKAVISVRPGQRIEREAVITWCRERLAAYKVPRVVEFIEELPKNASGKILRRLLRDESKGAKA